MYVFQLLASLSETLMAPELLESKIYGIKLTTLISNSPFPMVYPFLHSLNKVSCNRHSNAGIDKISLLQEYKIQPHVC